MQARLNRGFTLIEVMVVVAIIAILAGVALPSYTAYVKRSKVPAAYDALSAFAVRMEQRYQDTGCYSDSTTCSTSATNCGLSAPAASAVFSYSCSLNNSGQGYTLTATGSGTLAGYAYTINNSGTRATTAHPKGTNTACWTSKGGTQCDG